MRYNRAGYACLRSSTEHVIGDNNGHSQVRSAADGYVDCEQGVDLVVDPKKRPYGSGLVATGQANNAGG